MRVSVVRSTDVSSASPAIVAPGVLVQHGEHAPPRVIDAVDAQTRIERPRAQGKDPTEMEEKMVLEPESPGGALFRLRAVAQAKVPAPRVLLQRKLG